MESSCLDLLAPGYKKGREKGESKGKKEGTKILYDHIISYKK
jgi:hypothetical protein